MQTEMITQSEFARRMGFSRQQASKAVKAGRLTLVDGLLPWPRAMQEYLNTADIAFEPRSPKLRAWQRKRWAEKQ